jgi:ribosomal protein S18 acetylase RimI-like enzyme
MPDLSAIHIRTINPDDVAELYASFLAAFGDYSFNVNMSGRAFEQRLYRIGFEPSISVVAEAGGRIVGFVMHGQGFWGNQKTAYNGGTGVLPMYRGNGLTKAMYGHVLPILQQNNVTHCLLEVLVGNAPALETYRKVGFRIVRTLFCYVLKDNKLKPKSAKGLQLVQANPPEWGNYKSYIGTRPTWQNTWPSVARGVEHELEIIVEAYYKTQFAGFLAFEKASGKISQLFVLPKFRKIGIGSTLLRAAQELSGNRLTVLNLDSDDKDSNLFLERVGFEIVAKQFEMIYPI